MSRDLEFRNSLSRYDGAKNPVKKDDGTGIAAINSLGNLSGFAGLMPWVI